MCPSAYKLRIYTVTLDLFIQRRMTRGQWRSTPEKAWVPAGLCEAQMSLQWDQFDFYIVTRVSRQSPSPWPETLH